jgi:esterase/lipase superfamily enzyme
MKERTSWFSHRLNQEVAATRWGHYGMPVLIFPAEGGDAEEIERFQVIATLGQHLEQGKIKIYSCDGVAGRAALDQGGAPQHRMWVMNQFQEYVRHELVPWIWSDCRTPGLGIVAAGASIGASQALAAVCRYPDTFTKALCMSGRYDLLRFLMAPATADFWYASPIHWLGDFHGEEHLAELRRRFVLLASGEGWCEDIGESWRAAHVLGAKGVLNRVDSWGPEWHHDWPTWRNMLQEYLPDMVAAE